MMTAPTSMFSNYVSYNDYVAHRATMLRLTRYLVVFLVAGVVAAICLIHTRQWLLRHRAEQLLANIQSITLRQTQFDSIKPLLRRWERFGEYEGNCSEKHCKFKVTLLNGMFNLPDWLGYLVARLGGRSARVIAGFEVIDGIVWAKYFDVDVQMPPLRGEDGKLFSTSLLGIAESRSQFFPPHYWGSILLHSNYVIGRPGGCEGCVEAYVYFTPYADPQDTRRLMQFNLGCLTRWRACQDETDIMPVAWTQYSEERSKLEAQPASPKCSPRIIEMLGRDTENVAIVDVIANRTDSGSGGEKFQVSTVSLSARLKRAEFWNLNNSEEVRVFDDAVSLAGSTFPSEVHPGTKFIFLFAHRKEGGNSPSVWLETCGAIPFTESNLEIVKRGIGQDFRAFLPH
jgi:hypothetical protein